MAKRLASACTVVAVDDGSSRIERLSECAAMDQAAALAHHSPHIVLAAWMPPGPGNAGGAGAGAGGATLCHVHANRTHAFCRVGQRYLLTRGGSWLALTVTESGGPSAGPDKGVAAAEAVSFGPLVVGDGAAGGGEQLVWECREVEVL